MAAETWQMSDPRQVHPDRPVIDDESAQLLEDVIYTLGVFRSPMGHGDAGLRLHVLASLIAQAEALLPDAVADARDQDLNWAEIAANLAITPGTARRRYHHHARTRILPLAD